MYIQSEVEMSRKPSFKDDRFGGLLDGPEQPVVSGQVAQRRFLLGWGLQENTPIGINFTGFLKNGIGKVFNMVQI